VACDPGRHFLGYFFDAAVKEVTRQRAKSMLKKQKGNR